MRVFSTAGTLLLVLVGATGAGETPTIKIVDAVGPVSIGAPPVGNKPKASERQIAPVITKEFRFLGADGSVAVLISTKIRPDLPKDDRDAYPHAVGNEGGRQRIACARPEALYPVARVAQDRCQSGKVTLSSCSLGRP